MTKSLPSFSDSVKYREGETEAETADGMETLDLLDPDPFTIGLGIFTALAGGGAFLEARRQR